MTTTPTPPALDRLDERLQHDQGLGGALSSLWRSIKGGDVGVLPVVIGLLVICTIFQTLNPIFLSSANLVNLTLDSCAVGLISLGVVCVLLVGEIDLSVGSVSGLSGAIVGVLSVRHGWNWMLAIALACIVAVIIGVIYGIALTRFGMPSFVASLSGLLAFLGLQLAILGDQGSVNLPFDSALVHFAQMSFVPPWLSYLLAVIAGAAVFATGYERRHKRAKANLSVGQVKYLITRSVALTVGLAAFFWYLNEERGLGWMVVLFVTTVVAFNYAFTRTRWGRSLRAVGGNEEAARRSGINVRKIYITAFAVCTFLACVGGILAAARLASANLSSGTGDVNLNAIAAAVIGGTSLFGGRGSAYSALLGTLVIAAIASGLTLLNLDSSYRFIITGLVLAVAVAIDSVARKSRASHGRA